MIDDDFLQNVALFSNLEEKQLTLIKGLLKEAHYEAGAHIIDEGTVGVSVFIIMKGRVRIYLSSGQEQVELAKLGPGEFFGEMSLIDDHAAAATVEASEPTSVVTLTRADFKALLSSSTEISEKLWESLARNLNAKIRKTDELVRMYYGLNKALCEDPKFREFFSAWNFSRDAEKRGE
jgi:CRP/FNR family transcriptional regulator, cyclic AMP receptor protein